MSIDTPYVLLTILGMGLITFAVRLFPFLTASRWKDNRLVQRMGRFLPPAIMLTLVIYSLQDVKWREAPFGVAEILAVIVVALLHVRWRNPLISIVGGTTLFVAGRPLLAAWLG